MNKLIVIIFVFLIIGIIYVISLQSQNKALDEALTKQRELSSYPKTINLKPGSIVIDSVDDHPICPAPNNYNIQGSWRLRGRIDPTKISVKDVSFNNMPNYNPLIPKSAYLETIYEVNVRSIYSDGNYAGSGNHYSNPGVNLAFSGRNPDTNNYNFNIGFENIDPSESHILQISIELENKYIWTKSTPVEILFVTPKLC